jgi:hypothetical protein
MKNAYIAICIYLIFLTARAFGNVTVVENGNIVSIENDRFSCRFDLTHGLYSVQEKSSVKEVLTDAYFQVGCYTSTHPDMRLSWSTFAVQDAFGGGRVLEIKAVHPSGIGILMQIMMYWGRDFLVFTCGLDNASTAPVQLKNITPLIGAAFPLFPVKSNYFTLDGNGGGEGTELNCRIYRESRNNLLVTFGEPNNRHSLVAGGLTYSEFEKFVKVQREEDRIFLSLCALDPVGRRVDPGCVFLPNDKFYIDFSKSNPFTALEEYGQAVRIAQNINLPMYTFPTLCLWYAGHEGYGGGPAHNDSYGAVKEMQSAVKSGFLKYSPVAIRLVPDNYKDDNQQGWWDDAHFQIHGNTESESDSCYRRPYETTEKWGQAVTKLGGIPLMYSQTARRSEDFCYRFPEYLLFNNSHRCATDRPGALDAWWCGMMHMPVWSYDFTDPGFQQHMREVYSAMQKGGIRGLMYDYPATGWAYEGGFENPYATTASAYRAIFQLAIDGLGKDCYLDERNLQRGSDISLGLVASQRTWGDTDALNPLMVTKIGCRWYKNRIVINYDMDAKNPNHATPANRDGQRAMLTMSYVVSGRFLLGLSFSRMTADQLYDLSRIFPFYSLTKSARPADLFSGKPFPQVYDLEISPRWHQVTFYNTAFDSDTWKSPGWDSPDKEPQGNPVDAFISIPMSGDAVTGSLNLDTDKTYHVYDFWNDQYIGCIRGDAKLEQHLRPGEARMMSVHESSDHPQLLSTNRHVMQGLLDIIRCEWDAKTNTFGGTSKLIGEEEYKIVIASNGFLPKKCSAQNATCQIERVDAENGLVILKLVAPKNTDVDWKLVFGKQDNRQLLSERF